VKIKHLKWYKSARMFLYGLKIRRGRSKGILKVQADKDIRNVKYYVNNASAQYHKSYIL
jgi:hypothetical protein